MPASYTFDVYSTLDGFGSYGEAGDWGGYWGKEGPEFLKRRLDIYQQDQIMVLGANTFRDFVSMLGPRTGALRELDPVNTAMRNMRTTVISRGFDGELDWPDATLVADDAVTAVAELKAKSDVPLRSHGSLSMNRSLLKAGLVDQIQLTIFPALSGRTGTFPIFAGAEDFDLQLISSRTYDGHIQELIYRPTLHG
ncbi:dihydrofolate reductase family protein [Devosia sediminis]|uniref:Dihydrofolate reductase family protein n=1 Tax=Devosia sediminis TaxID=2798801 RepID=A0A934IY24_9HYPH|nr:dihydrofolate reductase family protein [Devosia sediminis]MBJ3785306.1 dihydrofolate reductase family protein [Devosia sediminis]